MIRVFIILFACIAVLTNCNKYKELGKLNEANDTARVYGRLFLLDTIVQQTLYLPQSKKKVIILTKEATDESNYLYSSTTDESGYFPFQHLTRNKEYRVVYNEIVNNILYRADTVVKPTITGLQLIARPSFDKQTGLYFAIVDPEGHPIPKANLCVFFDNPQGFSSGKCDKSNFAVIADGYGRAFLAGLKPGSYDYIASATPGSTEYKNTGNIVITNKVEQRVVKLLAPGTVTGIQYTVVDPSGFLVNRARVCLFENKNFYLEGSCDGSRFSDSTRSNGKVQFSNVQPGTFYARAQLMVNNRNYSAADTVTLSNGEFKNDTLWVK